MGSIKVQQLPSKKKSENLTGYVWEKSNYLEWWAEQTGFLSGDVMKIENIDFSETERGLPILREPLMPAVSGCEHTARGAGSEMAG